MMLPQIMPCEAGLHWSSGTGRNNELNFNARGAGERKTSPLTAPTTSAFYGLMESTVFWSNQYSNFYTTKLLRLTANGTNSDAQCASWLANLRNGNSVRVRRPATAAEQLLADGTACEPYTGNDGKIYRTVKIGTQVWTAENLAETKYRNGNTIPEVTDDIDWAALTTGALCAYGNDWSNV